MKTIERKPDISSKNRTTAKPLPILFSVYLADHKTCSDILRTDRITASYHELDISNQVNTIEGLDKCVFLFYGKPVFLSTGKETSNNVAFQTCLPCCFILDTEKIIPSRIFPFDPNICPHLPGNLSDFELETHISAILEHIKSYFKNNFNYIRGECKKDLDSIRSSKEKVLWNLLNDRGKTDGVKTVEIFCNEIELSTAIEAMIIPESVSKYDDCKAYITRHRKIKVLKYCDHYPLVPGKFDETVFQLLTRYHRQKGRLK